MNRACYIHDRPNPCPLCEGSNRAADRATRAFESEHVSRELLDNNVKSALPRIIDMIDGLLAVVESLGDSSEAERAKKARRALGGKQ